MFPFFDIVISMANFLDSPYTNISLPPGVLTWAAIGMSLLLLLSESSRKG